MHYLSQTRFVLYTVCFQIPDKTKVSKSTVMCLLLTRHFPSCSRRLEPVLSQWLRSSNRLQAIYPLRLRVFILTKSNLPPMVLGKRQL